MAPSMTTIGEALLIEVIPRMLMDPELPGLPAEVEIFNPGTAPWSMFVSEWEVLFSSSLGLTVVMAPVKLTFFWVP